MQSDISPRRARRRLRVCEIVAAALAGLALALPGAARAYTNTTTGTINLDGSVALVCSVSLDSTGATTNFPDLSAGTTNTDIGTIVEVCNDPDGYRVTLTTANGMNFKGASTRTLIPYTLTYNGRAIDFDDGRAMLTRHGRRTSSAGIAKSLAISFPSGYYPPDSYGDTVTITLIVE